MIYEMSEQSKHNITVYADWVLYVTVYADRVLYVTMVCALWLAGLWNCYQCSFSLPLQQQNIHNIKLNNFWSKSVTHTVSNNNTSRWT